MTTPARARGRFLVAAIPLLAAIGCLSASGSPPTQGGVSLDQARAGEVSVVAEGLEIPWELAFLPGGNLLITERPGRLLHITREGQRRAYAIEGVRHAGEGGLLGLALHPRFEENGRLYLYLTAADENRVERYRFEAGALRDRAVIIDGIPAAFVHDGGRIAFGPDGHLYVTTGDAANGRIAQDRNSLGGKILRLTDEGDIPRDNPFGSPVYTYGHRNPQGLAWAERGRLWSSEHGPSGGGSGFDELNRIEMGKNYGWPEIQGNETAPGMTPPAAHSGSRTWAPAGAAFWDGSVFFGGLRGSALYEARIASERVTEVRAHFDGELGRIRVVRLGPDGMLYVGTSNRDGRGRPREGDDKILRVDPRIFRR